MSFEDRLRQLEAGLSSHHADVIEIKQVVKQLKTSDKHKQFDFKGDTLPNGVSNMQVFMYFAF